MLENVAQSVLERGDLAHLALFLWALSASALTFLLLRELTVCNQRFSDFVSEIADLNQRLSGLRHGVNNAVQGIQKTRHF